MSASQYHPKIDLVIPELEAAVYGSLVTDMRTEWPHLKGVEDDELYRRVALGRYCLATTLNGKNFLRDQAETKIRHERHEYDGMEHHFLSVPSGNHNLLLDEDVVVDPTYLQFADNPAEQMQSEHPNIFIGTRLAIKQLMEDETFTTNLEAAMLYTTSTLNLMV